MITNNRFEPVAYRLPLDAAVARRDRLTKWLNDSIDEGHGLGYDPVFIGPTGTGKTFALLAMRDVRVSAYVDWAEFLLDIRAFYRMDTEDSHYFDPVRWASYYSGGLLLDDVGCERDPNGHDVEAFDRIVRSRAAHGMPLSFTTNLSVEAMGQRYGEAVMSRLGRMCHFIQMAGADLRLERA